MGNGQKQTGAVPIISSVRLGYNIKNMETRNCIDLFAGAGGLSSGLQMAGFNPLFATDIHEVYSSSYRFNHRDTLVTTEDVRNISPKAIAKQISIEPEQLDLIAGGPPCQGFSINAPIRSSEDERNHLFWHYLKFCEFFRPKFVLIENVPGIMSFDKGAVVDSIRESLARLGYAVEYRILFAPHFGIPQLRYRFVVIANRLGWQFEFPEPLHYAKGVANFTGSKELCQFIPELFAHTLKEQPTVWDAISDMPEIDGGTKQHEYEYPVAPQSVYQEVLREGSGKTTNHWASGLGKVNLDRLEFIPQGGSWRDIPFEYLPAGLKRARRSDHTKRYGRLHPDGLCSTILTKCDPHWGSFFHPFQKRVISVREAARMQSFPDTHVFIGSITQQYEQVGNAVPPLLAKALGDRIQKYLDQEEGKCQEQQEKISQSCLVTHQTT